MSVENELFPIRLPEGLQDRFDLLEYIGCGGTGTVVSAWDRSLQRKLAIKLLNPERTSARDLLRFQKEARTISSLSHPGIVEIYDFIFTDMNQPVLIMQLVEGESLDALIDRDGPLELPEATTVFEQLVAAIGYAHSNGVLHRDLACSNVLVSALDSHQLRIKVVDFGIARTEMLEDKTISVTGQLVGTATVISPEQARGQPTDVRSDIYSIGCLMFKVYTGVYPLVGDSYNETAQMQISSRAPSLTEKNRSVDYPEHLECIIARAMSKNPVDRYQTIEELKIDLHRFIEMIDNSEPSCDSPESLIQTPPDLGLALTRVNQRAPHSGFSSTLLFVSILLLCSSALLMFLGNQSKLFASGFMDISKRLQPPESSPKKIADSQMRIIKKNDTSWMTAGDKFADADLAEVRRSREIRRVSLRGSHFNDDILKRLCSLNLIALDLRDTEITDRSLQLVSHCHSLRSLLLSGCKRITDNGGRYLSKLDNLIIVDFSFTNLGDQSVKIVCQHDLRTLGVTGCHRITDSSVPSLLVLKNLDTLHISRTGISKASITSLFRKTGLGSLAVAGYQLEDKDFPIDCNRNFSRLDLRANNWSSKLIERLEGHFFPNLTFVRLDDCPGIPLTAIAAYSQRHLDLIIMPFHPFYNEDVDKEGYFDPQLFDSSGGNQEKLIRQLARWDVNDSLEKVDADKAHF